MDLGYARLFHERLLFLLRLICNLGNSKGAIHACHRKTPRYSLSSVGLVRSLGQCAVPTARRGAGRSIGRFRAAPRSRRRFRWKRPLHDECGWGYQGGRRAVGSLGLVHGRGGHAALSVEWTAGRAQRHPKSGAGEPSLTVSRRDVTKRSRRAEAANGPGADGGAGLVGPRRWSWYLVAGGGECGECERRLVLVCRRKQADRRSSA